MLPRPVVYVASKQSVLKRGTPTSIDFDIHINVHLFTNHKELKETLGSAIEKNRDSLFGGGLSAWRITGCSGRRSADA